VAQSDYELQMQHSQAHITPSRRLLRAAFAPLEVSNVKPWPSRPTLTCSYDQVNAHIGGRRKHVSWSCYWYGQVMIAAVTAGGRSKVERVAASGDHDEPCRGRPQRARLLRNIRSCRVPADGGLLW